MKRIVLIVLLCFAVLGVGYAQGQGLALPGFEVLKDLVRDTPPRQSLSTNEITCDQSATSSSCAKLQQQVIEQESEVPLGTDTTSSSLEAPPVGFQPGTPPKCEPGNAQCVKLPWQRFANSAFLYSFLFPPEAQISSSNDYATDLELEPSILVGIPGARDLLWVDAETMNVRESEYFTSPAASDTEKKQFELRKRKLSLPTQEYARAVHDEIMSGVNGYVSRVASDVEKNTRSGKSIYTFTVKETYVDQPPYPTPAPRMITYAVFENAAHVKIIVRYVQGDPVAKKIFESLIVQ